MARFSADPHWIVAKYAGTDRDGRRFERGDRVFYYPSSKTILAGEAAAQAARDFEAARADEESGAW